MAGGTASQHGCSAIIPEGKPWRGRTCWICSTRHALCCRPLCTSRVNLRQIFGSEAEWPEIWAIYGTLVLTNPSLSRTKKIHFLMNILRRKSDRAVKGVQFVPQNYEWKVQICRSNTGAKLQFQQLSSLKPANGSALTNEYMFNRFCMLLNQMVSNRENIRPAKDAMWTETIL